MQEGGRGMAEKASWEIFYHHWSLFFWYAHTSAHVHNGWHPKQKVIKSLLSFCFVLQHRMSHPIRQTRMTNAAKWIVIIKFKIINLIWKELQQASFPINHLSRGKIPVRDVLRESYVLVRHDQLSSSLLWLLLLLCLLVVVVVKQVCQTRTWQQKGIITFSKRNTAGRRFL